MRIHGSSAAEINALTGQLPARLRIAAVVPSWSDSIGLHPLEALLMNGESTERKQQFAAGRACSRELLAGLIRNPTPLLRRRDGAPDWPAGVRGSISHKNGLCIALAGPATAVSGVGIDLEFARALPAPIWERVFTTAELRRLSAMSPAHGAVTARLWFSAKECYYKWYRSEGGPGTPDFGDVDVFTAGTSLRLRPGGTSGLPVASGGFVHGDAWLITALWSAVPDPDLYRKTFNSLEVDQHGHTHRPTVHA